MINATEVKEGMLVTCRYEGYWLVEKVELRPEETYEVQIKQVLDGKFKSRTRRPTRVAPLSYCKPVTAQWIADQFALAEANYRRLAAVLSTMKVQP
jgi:hypothetical protein